MKQQRMILTDSMINLHTDFLIRNPTVKLSYSSFCTLKPFYITAPKASDRKTCLCQKHENAYLMLEVLRMSGVVKSNKLDDSFQLVCCSPASEACLLRTCSRCLNKGTVTTQEQDKIHVQWKQWERVQDDTVNGIHINTKLVQHSGSLSELIKLYEQIQSNCSRCGNPPPTRGRVVEGVYRRNPRARDRKRSPADPHQLDGKHLARGTRGGIKAESRTHCREATHRQRRRRRTTPRRLRGSRRP